MSKPVLNAVGKLRIMKIRIVIYSTITIRTLFACEKQWDDHYGVFPNTVNQNFWEAMQDDPNISISNFV